MKELNDELKNKLYLIILDSNTKLLARIVDSTEIGVILSNPIEISQENSLLSFKPFLLSINQGDNIFLLSKNIVTFTTVLSIVEEYYISFVDESKRKTHEFLNMNENNEEAINRTIH